MSDELTEAELDTLEEGAIAAGAGCLYVRVMRKNFLAVLREFRRLRQENAELRRGVVVTTSPAVTIIPCPTCGSERTCGCY